MLKSANHLTGVPLIGAGLIAILGACEVPDSPEWDVTLDVPFNADSLSVIDILPRGVDTATVNGERVFLIESASDSLVVSVAQACGDACRALQGQTVAVPGFTHTDSVDVLFETRLLSVELRSATLKYRLRNGLNFDPLRPDPNPALAGSLILVTRDVGSGALLDSTVVNGSSQALPPDSALEISQNLDIDSISEGLRTRITLASPFDGQIATVDTTLHIEVAFLLEDAIIEALVAVVESDTIDDSFGADLAPGVRKRLANELLPTIDTQVQGGALDVSITRNIGLEGGLALSFAGSRSELFSESGEDVRITGLDFSFAPAGRRTVHILERDAIRLLLTRDPLFVGYRGSASGLARDSNGRLTVRLMPEQRFKIELALGARLRLGG